MSTLKVRIAVAVDKSGQWSACGWSTSDPQQYEKLAFEAAVDTLLPGEARYWVEAELQVPERLAGTVQGAVVPLPPKEPA